jgi:hypothetical protein
MSLYPPPAPPEGKDKGRRIYEAMVCVFILVGMVLIIIQQIQ